MNCGRPSGPTLLPDWREMPRTRPKTAPCRGSGLQMVRSLAGERVPCPACNQPFKVRSDGKLRAHRTEVNYVR
jgi:hypothetical protein